MPPRASERQINDEGDSAWALLIQRGGYQRQLPTTQTIYKMGFLGPSHEIRHVFWTPERGPRTLKGARGGCREAKDN